MRPAECFGLDLPNPLTTEAELLANLFERPQVVTAGYSLSTFRFGKDLVIRIRNKRHGLFENPARRAADRSTRPSERRPFPSSP